jgi:RNA polymerase primary sigma factor
MDYRVTLKVQNNNILRLIEERGYASARQFCLNTGYGYHSLMKLINMRDAPIQSDGKLRQVVYKLAEILNCLPEELFSAAQMEASLETNKRVMQVAEAEMRFMLENVVEPKLIENQIDFDRLPDKIDSLLETLTPREAKVIAMRFGLGEEGGKTLGEIADRYGVGRERIRQIEAKALRKLRHPKRAKIVREYVDD